MAELLEQSLEIWSVGIFDCVDFDKGLHWFKNLRIPPVKLNVSMPCTFSEADFAICWPCKQVHVVDVHNGAMLETTTDGTLFRCRAID